MRRSRCTPITIATIGAVLLLGACKRPISDAAKLEAIRVEAQALMDTHPAQLPSKWRTVPKQQWPAAIASLHPEDVTVHTWGVDIRTKAYFDDGYGYDVPRNKAALPMPDDCYSEPSKGVFWHDPC